MPTLVEMPVKVIVPDFPPDELLISEDGVPLESDWHGVEIELLRDLVHQHFSGRDDFFAGGNMFIYFNEEQARNKDYRGPDFFFVWGATPNPLRKYWAIWKEGGRYPNLIVELSSPSTIKEDLTTKKDIYETTFRTPDYFCFDPDAEKLQGWHLGNGNYEPLAPNERGWLWSNQLQLWLGTWNGTYLSRDTIWLRFYTKDGVMVPTSQEAAQQQADEQRQRADAAEAELIQLKAQIERRKN
ncbi:MAG: Uma2 family endonuclease [Planctomycetes bacterium]|nr:Uma2 family endonuclease [Planctomycetota bacterium]